MEDKYYVQLNGVWVLLTVGGPDQRFIDQAMNTEFIMTVDEYDSNVTDDLQERSK